MDERHTTIHLIGIGFCQPKFYKPHVWKKAKKIMEWLCDHTNMVVRCDHGRGCGKYDVTDMAKEVDRDTLRQALADIYNKEHNITESA